jgi:charged multivesicular body protein 4
MSSWLSYFTGSGSSGSSSTSATKARTAIIDLREQLLTLDKQEDHMAKKIEAEEQKARLNATTNKRGTCCSLACTSLARREGLRLGGRCPRAGAAPAHLTGHARASEGWQGGRSD